MPFCEGGGAQHPLFLVVEEHEAHPVPVLGTVLDEANIALLRDGALRYIAALH